LGAMEFARNCFVAARPAEAGASKLEC
jgi:hypothetical protein